MGKRILITGAGKGKSYLAALLAEKYASEGIECEVTHVDCAEQAAKLMPPESGYQLVVSNHVVVSEPWQTIVVSGGC
jgi:CO dehydrogenase nickel-insertion accessory protein CooC1